MSLAYWPLYAGDYLADTQHLTTIQHGAYLLLLMAYYSNGSLSDSPSDLAAIARLSPSDWEIHGPVLAKFFKIENGHWINERAERELERMRFRKTALSQAAAKTNAKRWAPKTTGQAVSPSDSVGDSPSDSPSDSTRARYQNQNQSQNQKRGGAPPPPADAGGPIAESNGHVNPEPMAAERLAGATPPGLPDPPHGSGPDIKTPPDAISGDLAVELPRGFPRSEADAIRLAGTTAAPPDFIRLCWSKALGRGGRDSKDVPIRQWAGHLATEWAYEQSRRAQRNGINLQPGRSVIDQDQADRIADEKAAAKLKMSPWMRKFCPQVIAEIESDARNGRKKKGSL